ncbi:hypothetical protein SAICODRAFT_17488 [Saitoella complicata NRRL Y-17804]|nr:uncharacterized protein SAICODRAFT_17488 [Saitoella complicata NRRL Y-17804]ODQ55080.1 hypothetical protein SAICODRAFT_17488 [Saitoella complicata NRRL Y-17804]
MLDSHSLDFPYSAAGVESKLNDVFTQRSNPALRPLLRALSNRDKEAVWQEYCELAPKQLSQGTGTTQLSKGGLRHMWRTDFSLVLLSFRPRQMLEWSPDKGRVQSWDDEGEKKRFLEKIQVVRSHMESLGFTLGTQEWTHLLDCARAVGDVELARQFWREFKQSECTPNTYLYNAYIAAVCGTAHGFTTDLWKARDWQKMRDAAESSLESSPDPSPGHTVASLVQEMLKNKVAPNAATYDLLILAKARDGDIEGITNILEGIWGVSPHKKTSHSTETLANSADSRVTDVLPASVKSKRDLQKRGKPQGSRQPFSPLWPTAHTLLSIATAYGYNGNLPAAIFAVDLMARTYNIKITAPIWSALLRWSHVTSALFGGPTPATSTRALWDSMRSPPYNITPQGGQWTLMIMNELCRGRTDAVEELLTEMLSRKFLAAAYGLSEKVPLYVEEICRIHERNASNAESPEEADVHMRKSFAVWRKWMKKAPRPPTLAPLLENTQVDATSSVNESLNAGTIEDAAKP